MAVCRKQWEITNMMSTPKNSVDSISGGFLIGWVFFMDFLAVALARHSVSLYIPLFCSIPGLLSTSGLDYLKNLLRFSFLMHRIIYFSTKSQLCQSLKRWVITFLLNRRSSLWGFSTFDSRRIGGLFNFHNLSFCMIQHLDGFTCIRKEGNCIKIYPPISVCYSTPWRTNVVITIY